MDNGKVRLFLSAVVLVYCWLGKIIKMWLLTVDGLKQLTTFVLHLDSKIFGIEVFCWFYT